MSGFCQNMRAVISILSLALVLVLGSVVDVSAQSSSVRPPSGSAAPEAGAVPGGATGNTSDSELWRKVRHGVQGTVTIPDKKAGVLVQAEGDEFRMFRNGILAEVGGGALLVMVLILALFMAIRGRIKVEGGMSGRTVLRFNFIERFAHWLTAGSFIVLGLTGLNILYGKTVLMPLIGKSAFAEITYLGKLAHNYLGFAFTVGILLMIVIWIKDNFPNKYDFIWLAKGGGLFAEGVHPPAKKFNAGQKFIFWSVVILGLSLAATGICLLFPFEFAPFAGTFAILNTFGFDLPTELTLLQETQLALLWHNIIAMVLIVIIIGHIYIGSIGMEGAIDAVTTGEVDEQWAREHHSVWLEERRADSD